MNEIEFVEAAEDAAEPFKLSDQPFDLVAAPI
jgi:hypothetical protein